MAKEIEELKGSINATVFPWQQEIWAKLNYSNKTSGEKQIAHALLFSGSKGVGKLPFSFAFKDSLLCSENKKGERACGECRFCRIPEHPDFHEVTFEINEKTGKISSTIKIDQIRKVIEFSHMHSHYGKAKIILIHPAEAMNNNAANALLKILEEPPQNTYFILVTNELHRLSATIKSRCQLVKFQLPDTTVSIQWLQSESINAELANTCLDLAYNAPLTAKSLAESNYSKQHTQFIDNLLSVSNRTEDPMVIASSWLKINSNMPLQALYSCLSDLILLKTMQKGAEITNKQNQPSLQNIADNVSFTGLYVILDKISAAKFLIQSNINLLGIYEDILNLWQRLTINSKIN